MIFQNLLRQIMKVLAHTSGGSAFSLALAQSFGQSYLVFLDLSESARKTEWKVASCWMWAAGSLLHFPLGINSPTEDFHRQAANPLPSPACRKARARRYLCSGCPRLLFHQFSTLNTESHVEIVQLHKRCVIQKMTHEVWHKVLLLNAAAEILF